MREIKFRAWDKENKIFHYPNKKENNVSADFTLNAWCDSENDRNVLMQYTGLKDKTGKEIYEGDICRFSEHYFGDSHEKECIDYIIWDEKECCYSWKLTHTGYADGPNWCEVIGNIYENPELLESKP